jgi:hypothetical protein
MLDLLVGTATRRLGLEKDDRILLVRAGQDPPCTRSTILLYAARRATWVLFTMVDRRGSSWWLCSWQFSWSQVHLGGQCASIVKVVHDLQIDLGRATKKQGNCWARSLLISNHIRNIYSWSSDPCHWLRTIWIQKMNSMTLFWIRMMMIFFILMPQI